LGIDNQIDRKLEYAETTACITYQSWRVTSYICGHPKIENEKDQIYMKNKILFWAVLVIGLLTASIAISSVILSRLNGVDWLTILPDGSWILALSMTCVAVLIALRRPENPLGWIFLAIGFTQGLVSFSLQYSKFALVTSPTVLPGGDLMSWVAQIAWFPSLSLLLTYAIMLFPTGALPSHRWRSLAWASAIPLLLFLPVALSFWPDRGLNLLLNPDSVTPTSGVFFFLLILSFPTLFLCGVASLVSLIIRYRKGDLIERHQIKWVAFAAGLFLLMELLSGISPVYAFFTDHKISFLIVIPVSLALPAAIGIAILRYRLLDIDILINRTLVYIPLTGILAGLVAASMNLLQRGFIVITGAKSDIAVVLTTLILTSAFTPIKNALQAFVDRRFKNPLEPLAALKTFKRQIQAIEEVMDRESAARRFLDESASALQASCGAVLLTSNGVPKVVSVSGDWKAGRETLTIPIGKEAGNIGILYLGIRNDGTAYTEAESSLLAGVASSLGRVLSLVDAG
jgi:hypothetical protein